MLTRSEKMYDGDIHLITGKNSGEKRAENRRVELKLIPEGKEF